MVKARLKACSAAATSCACLALAPSASFVASAAASSASWLSSSLRMESISLGTDTSASSVGAAAGSAVLSAEPPSGIFSRERGQGLPLQPKAIWTRSRCGKFGGRVGSGVSTAQPHATLTQRLGPRFGVVTSVCSSKTRATLACNTKPSSTADELACARSITVPAGAPAGARALLSVSRLITFGATREPGGAPGVRPSAEVTGGPSRESSTLLGARSACDE